MQRLGETAEFGSLLIRLCQLRGWRLNAVPVGRTGLHWFTLERAGVTVGPHVGEHVADVAVPLFLKAVEHPFTDPPEEHPFDRNPLAGR